MIIKLVEKGVLLRCPENYPEVVIPTFAIQQHEKYRLIWDGTPINAYCCKASPKYPTIDEILRKSPKGKYISRDWKSAFQQVPLRFDEIRKLGIQFTEEGSVSYAV